ncbi:hypothetical protein R1flu_001534 [Riccia fluitans]|uniref:Uncharacterized protein n=1 Tax=Riccia fluitans TaxID=41844 RepID=A0ABD1Y3J4_9MARC
MSKDPIREAVAKVTNETDAYRAVEPHESRAGPATNGRNGGYDQSARQKKKRQGKPHERHASVVKSRRLGDM